MADTTTTAPKAARRKLLILLCLAVLAGLGLVAALWLGFDLRALASQFIALITSAGPLVFFCAMAVMPAMGVPVLTFVLTAGPAFGESLGMPMVVACSLAALFVNMLLSYALARRGLRPLLAVLIARFGHKVPSLEGGDAKDLVVMLRVTPGIPFCVQNYLSGLANVPFATYIVISCLLALPTNAAFVVFGDALLHGKARVIFIALCCIAALTAATHMLRRHMAGRAQRKALA